MVGVSQTGPTLIWSGRSAASARDRGVELLGRVGREADERAGPGGPRASATGGSSWPTWTPSAPSRGNEVGAVVEDEEGAVGVGGAPEGLGEGDQLLGAAGAFSRSWITPAPPRSAASSSESGSRAARPRLADEVEAGGAQALDALLVVHRRQG